MGSIIRNNFGDVASVELTASGKHIEGPRKRAADGIKY